MKIRLAPWVCLLLAASAGAETSPEKQRSQFIRNHYAKFEYRIPMRDGKRLFTSVYVPHGTLKGERFPFVITRTPYSVMPYGQEDYPSVLGPSEDFEKEGFIFVQQDVRGRWMSEGDFVNMRPLSDSINESNDTYDTIDWLVRHVPGNNGRASLRGISYPGFYSMAGAVNGHPALKLTSPQAPIADWWRGDDMHRNGAFNLQLAFTFLGHFGRPRSGPTPEFFKAMEWTTTDAYGYFLELGSLRNAAARYGFENRQWQEMVEHPNYDDYWQKRNLLPHLNSVTCPTVIVGGWYDTEDLYGPLNIYKTLRKSGRPARLVMGPWDHGGWQHHDGSKLGDADFGAATSQVFRSYDLALFKHYLKDGGAPGGESVWVFETGANRWRSFSHWPPVQAHARKLYFRESQQLRFEGATGGEGHDDYVSDPAKPVPYTSDNDAMKHSRNYMTQDQRFASRRPDVLVYQTEVLARPLTLAGPIEVDVWMSTTESDMDLVVKLIDVNPGKTRDGKRSHQQTLVRGEPMRVRFRDDPAHPKPLRPGEKTRVRYRLNDVFHTFGEGHRLMLHVQSSWFPFIDRNPQHYVDNIFAAGPGDFRKATHRLFRDKEHPSHVVISILPAADEAEAPGKL